MVRQEKEAAVKEVQLSNLYLLQISPLTRMNGTQTKQISVSSLSGAVYFLKTEIGNQAIYKRILIITN